ncbi:MAG: DUF2442 domain-containing protein [Kiritimatiellia bacterium]
MLPGYIRECNPSVSEIRFDDGVSGIVDLSNLAGKGVFSLWNDYSKFRKVQIAETDELIWGEQIDLCPDSLYMKITEQTVEQMFPAIKSGVACA